MLAAAEDDAHGKEDALHDAGDGVRYPRCEKRSQYETIQVGMVKELTRPVRAWAERDAEYHEDRAGSLDAHHGDAERADELDAPGMRYLGDVLERGEQGGCHAQEHRPELELAGTVDLIRVVRR